jgi:ketosteroid isomerase-like protein
MRASIGRSAGLTALLFAVLASWVGPVFAQPPAGERNAAALMAVEQQWLTALQRRDVAALARILGREFIDSDYLGDAISRRQYLDYFAHAPQRQGPPTRQEFEEVRVRFVAGGEVAIVTGVVLTRSAAKPGAAASSQSPALRHSRFTDVFVWRQGRWQAVTGQETHFSPGRR